MSDLSLSVSAENLESLESDVLVLGVYSSKDGAQLMRGPLSEESAEGLEELLEDLGVTGSEDQLVRLPGLEDSGAELLALIGLGKKSEDAAERLRAYRYAAGSATRQLAGFEEIAFGFETETVADLAAIAEGVAYGAFADAQLRSKTIKSVKDPIAAAVIISEVSSEEAIPALERALILGEAVNHTRHLVNTPPSHLYPETLAEAAQERIAELDNVSIKVYDEEALVEGGFGGLAGVGQGSTRGPRLIEVTYAPEGAETSIALVGKGITFDTGGISLKPAGSMTTMKSDMAGAATVLNALVAIAELEVPVKVTAYLCAAENMPGGNSIRPEDVLTMRSGHTVEVLNTDAEGRLVMADGLALASEAEHDVILDVATLTGAQLVAFGTRYAAVMGNEKVRDQIVAASLEAGEDFWAMPLPEHLRATLKSPVADLKNIGAKWGGMLSAALFLEEFVGEVDGEKIPWAHLDIAGPSFNEESPYGFTPKEGTGMSLPTLVKFVESYAK